MRTPEWCEIVEKAQGLFSEAFLSAVNSGVLPEQHRSAATFYLLTPDRCGNDPFAVQVWMGDFQGLPLDRSTRYVRTSLEKAHRLQVSGPEIQSSWETRDPESDKWGGGIKVNDHILSLSGLPELWDEIFVVCVALKSGIAGVKPCLEIMEKSGSRVLFDRYRDQLSI